MAFTEVRKTTEGVRLSLSREEAAQLGLQEGVVYTVTLDDATNQIVLSPVGAAVDVDLAFAEQVAAFIEAYRPALEALAR